MISLRRLIPLLAAALLGLLALAPGAHAQSIFRDCEDGSLDGDYSPSQIREARQNIPTDVDEYTDCRDVLTAALSASLDDNRPDGSTGGGGAGASGGGAGTSAPPDASAGGGGGASAGSGSSSGGESPAPELLTPANPDEQAALQSARDAEQPVSVGGESLVPSAAALAGEGVRQDIPTPLIVVLVLLGALAAVAAATALGTRVRHRLRRG